MAEFAADKLADTRANIEELSTFAAQLQAMSERLEIESVPGACSGACVCVDESATTQTVAVSLGTLPSATVAIACTLAATQVPDRIQQWHDVINRATRRTLITHGMRLSFRFDPSSSARWPNWPRKSRHVAFYTFAITIVDGRADLDVTAPPGATKLVTALFGAPA
ncbi:MAG: hypothetical protein ABI658_25155 [Acidimicrobiales bacterium]